MLNRNRALGALTTILLAAALPLGLAGCSSGAAPSGADAGSSGSGTSASGIGAKWGACMREAGFDIEDPTDATVESGTVVVPPGNDSERFLAAGQQCSDDLGVQRQDKSAQDKWARQYDQVASCIRDNGYEDYPEQTPGTIDTNPESYPRAAEDGFKKVFDECLRKYSPDTQFQQVG